MTHDEVFMHLKSRTPEFATKQVLVWYPCGYNTIRLVMVKDHREFCYTAGPGPKDHHLRLYAEWYKETFDDEEPGVAPIKPYERNYPYDGNN